MTDIVVTSRSTQFIESTKTFQVNHLMHGKNRKKKLTLGRDNHFAIESIIKHRKKRDNTRAKGSRDKRKTSVCKSRDTNMNGKVMLTNNMLIHLNSPQSSKQLACPMNFASALMEPFGNHKEKVNLVQDWDFNALAYFNNGNAVYSPEDLVLTMFQDLGLLRALCIEQNLFLKFVSDVVSQYRTDVPFHNFNHALTIVHMSYLILRAETFFRTTLLSKLDQFALLVAAICHDIDHDGFSNRFHVQSTSARASKYQNLENVQEMHHVAVTMALIRKHYATTFSHFDEDQRSLFEALIRSCILCTDMGKHFALKEEFDAWINEPEQKLLQWSSSAHREDIQAQQLYNSTPISPSSVSSSSTILSTLSSTSITDINLTQRDTLPLESKKLLLGMILHCVDLSNSVRTFDTYYQWVNRLTAEFLNQVKVEEESKLISEEMMRAETEIDIAMREIGFVKHIVIPIWDSLSTIAPSCKARVAGAHENITRFESIVAGKGVN